MKSSSSRDNKARTDAGRGRETGCRIAGERMATPGPGEMGKRNYDHQTLIRSGGSANVHKGAEAKNQPRKQKVGAASLENAPKKKHNNWPLWAEGRTKGKDPGGAGEKKKARQEAPPKRKEDKTGGALFRGVMGKEWKVPVMPGEEKV